MTTAAEKTQVERLADFAHRASFEQIPGAVLDRLKLHLLDTLGCSPKPIPRSSSA